MRDFIKLLRRFLPPYKGKVVLNFVFNFLAAVFGAFSFGLLSPVLGILFETKEYVRELMPFEFSAKVMENNLSYYITWIIDSYGQSTALIYIGLFIIVTVLLKVGFTYLASFMMITIRNGVVRDIRSKIYRKIISLPLGFFSNEKKGDIMARMMGDVQEIENSIMNSLDMLFKNPVLILISLVYMVYTSWSLTIFVFIMLPVTAVIIGSVGKSLKKQSLKGQDKQGEILSIIDEDITGLRVIKAFTAERKAIERFERENENYKLIMNKLMSRYFLAHPMSEFLGTAVIIMVLWYGGNLILSGEAGALTPQQFIVYLVFFYNIINPAKAFSTALYSVEKGLASVERIDKILEQENSIKEKSDTVNKTDFTGLIEYRNVSFKYTNDYVLKNINLTIKKGQTIALVGKSGSGKTTMADLLPRFWDVSEGGIFIDGTDIRDMKMHDLRSLMGNVNQDAILFNDTFFNNIAFGVENATINDVINAAKIANAHEFIMATENGYNTNIGDRGDKLSGGQKQRISIARAILKNPPILILDEATSALDTESEKLVQEALDNLMKNRTSLVIAHRLSTIKNAGLICVIHEGKLIEKGTHEELVANEGQYFRLHRMQNL
ncbi:MAG: ABC transporter ATP-binding protein/permease [Bacteroidales bacterium]|jgi:subfamily B ATP-binding cassette protein MsbA|nr:ABC transporter ATP-binding protein/permease [Bacteroidales bacterium]